jgi:alpha-beta hydrolase superfamily lysophospholipase
MGKTNMRKTLRSVFKWILWVFLAQFVLINISGIIYGYKLTHFYEPALSATDETQPRNVFIKTWRLFKGPAYRKITNEESPEFPYQTVHLLTKDSLSLEAWFIPIDSSKGTVILFHGLGGNKSNVLKQAYEFRYLGFNVMLVDLRAHGMSKGNTTTIGFRESEDVKLAYEYVLKKGEKNIILYGISLGSVVIAKAFFDYNIAPSRIILEIPFSNMKKLIGVRGRMIGFPEKPFGGFVTFWASIERGFNGFKQDTYKYAQKINCPVLMQCGATDIFASDKERDIIFKSIPTSEKKLVVYEHAVHQPLLDADPLKWRQEVSEFVSK